jgi:hypothetical protein
MAAAWAAPGSRRRRARARARACHAPTGPTRVRCVSIFLDKNRRYICKYQSEFPPKRTQRTRTLVGVQDGLDDAPRRLDTLLLQRQLRLLIERQLNLGKPASSIFLDKNRRYIR